MQETMNHETINVSTMNSQHRIDATEANPHPERKLTLFAVQLAILEKTASGLAALGFIWATVVLLGGFAITLGKTDFWVITAILLVEGARIFSRSHELEWQHQVTRTCRTPDMSLLPYTGRLFRPKNIAKLLSLLQVISALACLALSLWRLVKQDFGEVRKDDYDKRNRKSALNIFYGLALAEAILFLVERTYWFYKVVLCKLLQKVNIECKLGDPGLASIKRFFYAAYSRCVNGSIFDGLKMDLVSFGAELLESSFCEEQVSGMRIIRNFAADNRFKNNTLRKVENSMPTLVRLLEMLNWKESQDRELRLAAGEILSNLAGERQNCLCIACISGAMESISSLLPATVNENHEETVALNHLGLSILKNLATDLDSCEKISRSKGLLQQIIQLTHAKSHIATVRISLELVNMLVGTTGSTGRALRKEISDNVFTVSNIRQMLQNDESDPTLQELGIQILTSLAMDEEAKEKIGRTGGLLGKLLSIFVGDGLVQSHEAMRNAAGGALAMLALNSMNNCSRLLASNAAEKLVGSLESQSLRINAAEILRNLCACSGEQHVHLLQGVADASNIVISFIVSEENKLQEVAIGLLAQIYKLARSSGTLTSEESEAVFDMLVKILKRYEYPSTQVPRIRRFVIELAISMMNLDTTNIQTFRDQGLKAELKRVVDTTSEIECFNEISGGTGKCPTSTTVHSLYEEAIQLLNQRASTS